MSKTWKWVLIIVGILLVIGCLCSAVAGTGILVYQVSNAISDNEIIITEDPMLDLENPTDDEILEESNSPDESETNELAQTNPEQESVEIEPDEEAAQEEAGRAEFADYSLIMEEAWQLVNQYFVKQPLDGELLIDGAIRGLFESLPVDHPLYLEYDLEAYTISSGAEESTGNPDFYSFNLPLEDAWNQAYDQATSDLDPNKLIQGAMYGMMTSLGDKHSMYLSPSELTQLSIDQEGEYEGIGAWVDTSGEYITIISPMAGSPAEDAGLKTGDVVIAIDGEDLTGLNPDIALQKILGPAGSIIVLTVEREGESAPLDIEITRAKITVPSVEYEMLDNNIGYLQLSNFGENTSDEFNTALQDLQNQGMESLIFDLRGNGGGYLYTAVNILSQFIEENTPIIYQVYGDGTEDVWETDNGGIALDIPMVLLVDGGSASASEITVGALQDLERATVIGTTTYGKGSVHYVLPLSNENGAVQVTIAKWLTPNKRFIHEIGIDPDIVVEFDEEAWEADGTDNQLEKAIEVIMEIAP